MSGVSSSTMATLQQWGQILADQQRMVQFNSLLAMTSALPNMTPKVTRQGPLCPTEAY